VNPMHLLAPLIMSTAPPRGTEFRKAWQCMAVHSSAWTGSRQCMCWRNALRLHRTSASVPAAPCVLSHVMQRLAWGISSVEFLPPGAFCSKPSFCSTWCVLFYVQPCLSFLPPKISTGMPLLACLPSTTPPGLASGPEMTTHMEEPSGGT